MTHLILGGRLRAQIETQARAAYPRECCGLVEGIRRRDFIEASTIHATGNVAAEADRFEIDPAEHIRLLRAARASGREIIGCYHSHPNGRSDLSARDREHADEDGFVWLIVSLSVQDVEVLLRAFIVANGNFEPLSIASCPVTGSGADKDGLR
jgi:proteasome lid subunit RPN8/RPN11